MGLPLIWQCLVFPRLTGLKIPQHFIHKNVISPKLGHHSNEDAHNIDQISPLSLYLSISTKYASKQLIALAICLPVTSSHSAGHCLSISISTSHTSVVVSRVQLYCSEWSHDQWSVFTERSSHDGEGTVERDEEENIQTAEEK